MLAIAVVAAVVAVAGGAVALVGAVGAHARAAAAADLAALAGADAASGRVPGVPCEIADAVARANGAALASCTLDGHVLTVCAAVPYFGMSATASARAGPPREVPP